MARDCGASVGVRVTGDSERVPDAPGYSGEEAFFYRKMSAFRGKVATVTMPFGNSLTGLVEAVYPWGMAMRTGDEPLSDSAPHAVVMFSGIVVEEAEAIVVTDDAADAEDEKRPCSSCASGPRDSFLTSGIRPLSAFEH